MLKLVLEIGTSVLFSENEIASSTAREGCSFVIKILTSEISLSICFTNKKFRVWTFCVFQKNIAIELRFLKTLKERYLLLSGHRNVAFLPVFRVKMGFLKNLCENDAKVLTI